MKPAPFQYHAPATVDEAVGLLADLDDAKPLAGGQSLIPLLALRLAKFEHVVDIGRIAELRRIERRDGAVLIGSAATQAAVEHSTEIADAVPLLARAMPLIGHFQIRNRGTVGGSLAHADPASEIPAVAVALDAELEAASPRGRRQIPASEFFTGTWTTALDDDEILSGVRFPVWGGRCGFAIDEFSRRHGDFAIAGACVAVQLGDDDVVRRCAIGLLGLGSTPLRADVAERSVSGVTAGDVDPRELGEVAIADLDAIPSDLNGSAEYRARVGATVVARAWNHAVEEALHG